MEKSFNVPLPRIHEQLKAKEQPALRHEAKHKEKRIYEARCDNLSTNMTRSVIPKKTHADFKRSKISFEEFISKWEQMLTKALSIPPISFLRPQLDDLSWYLGLQKDHDEIEWLALVLTLHIGESGSTFLDAFEKMKSWAKVLTYFEATTQDKVIISNHNLETSNFLGKIRNILRRITSSWWET